MTAHELLTAFRERGVDLKVEGGRLRISAPPGVLNAQLQSAIALHKAEVMRIVESASEADPQHDLIERVSRESNLPLSLSQQRLWFLDRLEPGGSAYNLPAWQRLRGPIDVVAMEWALNELVRRHEILRTTFPDIQGIPHQNVAPPAPLALPLIDLGHLSREESASEFRRIRTAEAERPFDLRNGPLFRTLLIRIAAEEHALLFTVHHIIFDGWSLGIFAKEFAQIYEAVSQGRPSPLPELAIQYADYAAWQRRNAESPNLAKRVKECVQRLEGTSGFLPLPTDRPRPPVQTHNGSVHSFLIPSNVAEGLRALSRSEGVTLFMTLAGIFSTLLHRSTGREDILIGCPIAGRDRTELEPLIGMFANTVVLRADLSGRPTFKQLLVRMRNTVLDAFSHQDVPFEKLVEVLGLERSRSHSPLFQVALVLHNTPIKSGFEFTTVSSAFDLTLFISDYGGDIAASIEYNTDLFDAATISRMAEHFGVLADGISGSLTRSIGDLEILRPWESRKLLVEWNDTQTDYPRSKCVHRLFEEVARATAESVAISILPKSAKPEDSRHYTFREVNRVANQLAFRLKSLGVGPDTRVALCLERSLEMIVSVLAILKTGGCYVPLDPAYPAERIKFMLDDSDSSVVLTDTKRLSQFSGCRGTIVCIDRIVAELEKEPDTDPADIVRSDSLAYIMYTSGSTGEPKGVCVTHQNIVRLVRNTNYVKFTRHDVFLLLAPISFDASTFELWGSLLNGARLVVAPHGQLSLEQMRSIIETNRISILWLTAGLFHLMVERHLSSFKGIRYLLAGGDVLSAAHVRQVVEALGEGVLVNGYGPTENTTFTSCYAMNAGTAIDTAVPIGRPISNTQLYVLDDNVRPVPIGVIGELFAGGDGVAQGYWKRPELTAEAFVPDNFSGIPGKRLYRTGDMVRYRADGVLEFLGRKDTQVKVRGHRIELAEIETVLLSCPGVLGVTVAAGTDHKGETVLIAFVIPAGSPAPSAATLRRFLSEKIPAYMIPTQFAEAASFPLSANGKVDRAALLQRHDVRKIAPEKDEIAENLTEIQMLNLWNRVLNRNDIGLADDFFEAGGHSLLAVELFAEIQRVFGRHLPLSTLFDARTAKEMAAVLLRTGWEPKWEALVNIQPGGALPPLFLVPGRGGNVVGLNALAKALGAEQPVYGLQSLGFNGKDRPLNRIEDIAARFIAEIQEVQSEGPVVLAGACMGGLVAYEMAQQLQAQGREASLILIETWPPGAMQRKPALFDWADSFARRIYRSWKEVRGSGSSSEKKWEYLWDRLKKSRRSSSDDRMLSALQTVAEANQRAAVKYIPKFYTGAACLVLASGRPVTGDADPRLEWARLTSPALDVHLIPGNDSGQMLTEPNVINLGATIQSHLKKMGIYRHSLLLSAILNSWSSL